MVVWVVLTGLVVGLALGALGGGGSILTVPALVHLIGQDPREATTGSLVVVGISSLMAMSSHYRAGQVRVGLGLLFGALGSGGAYLGSRLSRSVDPDVLMVGFALFMLVVAAAMWRRTRRQGGQPPSAGEGVGLPDGGLSAVVKVVLAATGVGLLTGFFGVGGGFVIVPALVLTLGFSMPAAVGTSLLVIVVNSALALGFRLESHAISLDWPVLAARTAIAAAASLVGARIEQRVGQQPLAKGFVVMLVLVALGTAAGSLPALL